MFNKIILIGRLGQNADAKTTQNSKDYVVLNLATQESWKNDKGEGHSIMLCPFRPAYKC